MNLKDKVVVITGSSKGFGKALAEAFLKEGAKVVINSRDEEEIKKVADEIGAYGVAGDVTKEEEMTTLANGAITQFGGIDIWVNNAGLWMKKTVVENLDMEMVKKMFDVNIIGTINGCRAAIRIMQEKREGTIINILSDAALIKRPRLSASAYMASKYAVNGFTNAIHDENKDISILSVFPGAMKTEIFGDNVPDNFNEFMEPEYVAQKVIENLKKDNPEDDLLIQKEN